MAIATDAGILFYGTEDTLTTTGASTADGVVTQANSTVWPNDDDAPEVSFRGIFTFATAPADGTTIKVLARVMNINGTTDEAAPTATYQPHPVAAFSLLNTTSAQDIITGPVSLPTFSSSDDYQFYIENNGGQTLSVNWSLYVTPVTLGPHA